MDDIKFPQELRLKLIERVTKDGINVSQACKEFGVSRFTFYKWYKRYLQGGSTSESLADKKRGFPQVNKEEIRRKIIERVVKDKIPVSQVCTEFGISRFTFYKWYKRWNDGNGN